MFFDLVIRLTFIETFLALASEIEIVKFSTSLAYYFAVGVIEFYSSCNGNTVLQWALTIDRGCQSDAVVWLFSGGSGFLLHDL
jgi:hypothetical protein